MIASLEQLLQETPYRSYTYAYPHKTAYRPFPAPLRLDDLWATERRQALFLYLHVPFCEMRCGFCNLFTTLDPNHSLSQGYLDALERQARETRDALGDFSIARMAIGGGTPTFMTESELAHLLHLAASYFGVTPGSLPTSVESSPATASMAKLRLLREWGVDRISIGVQSFDEQEVHAVGRTQKASEVEQALQAIRSVGFPTLNIDLIYGLPGQTVQRWLASLQAALRYQPEELYLYPLYVRPLTGLDRVSRFTPADDLRLQCYREARALLTDAGYQQISMRMFRAAHAPEESGPVYCVQDDGMVGLGCGARSYTSAYHYSNEYAVQARGVRAILARYSATTAEEFALASYGFYLNEDEQRRRYILKSLLEMGGVSLQAYRTRFKSDLFSDLPQLTDLITSGMAVVTDDLLTLTTEGTERSDAIGPWLYSRQVQELMERYTLQ